MGAVGRRGAARPSSACAQRLDEPFDRELAVAPLAPLVLGDARSTGPALRDHAALLLRRGERRRRLDVEHGLDPRLRALGVLTARAARAGEAQLDLVRGRVTERVTRIDSPGMAAILLDVDGVLHVSGEPIPGAADGRRRAAPRRATGSAS